jgi:hypothetical protein
LSKNKDTKRIITVPDNVIKIHKFKLESKLFFGRLELNLNSGKDIPFQKVKQKKFKEKFGACYLWKELYWMGTKAGHF